MKTTIETKTAGTIKINSVFKGNKLWKNGSDRFQNWNNHKVTVTHNGQKFSFDFWGSIANPEISNDQENVFALYCALSDGLSAENDFNEFCSEFGYDNDSRTAERIYKACEKTNAKINRVFSCDLYDLINEIQEDYNCFSMAKSISRCN